MLHKLVINNEIVGYRIRIRDTEYDISKKDKDLIQEDFDPFFDYVYETKMSTVPLVRKGDLLVPVGLSEAPELTYAGYAKLNGLDYLAKTDTDLKIMYNYYNEQCFFNKLPKLVAVGWDNRLKRTAGVCKRQLDNTFNYNEYIFSIWLSISYHRINPADLVSTLVHEMIHVKYPGLGHGKEFKQEMERLNKEFGFNISVYAHGELEYKYIYECASCRYQYKRIRKIRNVSQYSCSACGGRIYLAFES